MAPFLCRVLKSSTEMSFQKVFHPGASGRTLSEHALLRISNQVCISKVIEVKHNGHVCENPFRNLHSDSRRDPQPFRLASRPTRDTLILRDIVGRIGDS